MPLSIRTHSSRSRSRSIHGSSKHSESDQLIPSSPLRGFTRKQKIVIALAAGAQAIQFFAESAVPLLFPPEALAKGLSHLQYSAVMAAMGLAFGIAIPFQSALVPRIGLKTGFVTVIMIGGLGYVMIGLLHFVCGGSLFTILALVTRAVQGVCFSAAVVAEMAMMCLNLGDSAGNGFAIGTFTEGIGFALGPVIAGPLAQATSFAIPFLLAGLFMLTISGASFCVLEPQYISEGATKLRLSDVQTLLKDRYVIVAIFQLVVTAFAWVMVHVTLEQHLARYDYGVGLEGLMFGLGDTVYGLSAPLWGWLGGRHPKFGLYAMLVSPFLGALGNVFLGPIPGLSALDGYLAIDLASLVVVKVAMSLLSVGSSAVMLQRAEVLGMPSDLGTYSLVTVLWFVPYCFSNVLGTVAGAQIFAAKGFSFLTLINVVLLIAVGVVSLPVVCTGSSEPQLDPGNPSSTKVGTQSAKDDPLQRPDESRNFPSLLANSYGAV